MDKKLLDITKDELNKMDVEELNLPVVIIDETSSFEDVSEACDKLLEGPKILGFDTETKPCFRKGEHRKVALLQLSSQNIVVLVRLIKIEDKSILEPLIKILKNKRIAKVGIAIGDDVRGLYNSYEIITNKFLDLRVLAKASGIGALSLTKIYGLLFGKRISKSQQLSDWERPQFTEAQIRYAGLDAYSGLCIYMKLKSNAKKDMYQHFQKPEPPKKKKRRCYKNNLAQNSERNTKC